jgi:hypothetical protein
LKNKGFKEERMPTMRLEDLGQSTTLESNKSLAPGTGDCLDQAITTTSNRGIVTFNIPSVCGTADQTQFLIQ